MLGLTGCSAEMSGCGCGAVEKKRWRRWGMSNLYWWQERLHGGKNLLA